ncbi:retrovirus-related pol polyprotein from transposon TNT 1-94 [Tanacetum coccineum]
MSSNSDDIQAAGFDTRPPMLDRTDYESWSQRIRLYCRGKENGLQILQSIDQGPFELGTTRNTLGTTPEGGVLLGPERPRTYDDLSDTEKKRYDADVRATNIVLQGLPKDIHKLINHNIEAKAIWDNVKMLLPGSELTKEDRESQLYDEFERFKMLPGENINEYYVRFHKLVNDMRNIRMTMPNIQLNSKFVNNMSPEWDRFMTAVKLNKGLKETNHEQLYAYLKQHEKHVAPDRLIIERITPTTNDQLALVSTFQPYAQSSHVQSHQYPSSLAAPQSPHIQLLQHPQFPETSQIDSGHTQTDEILDNLTKKIALLPNPSEQHFLRQIINFEPRLTPEIKQLFKTVGLLFRMFKGDRIRIRGQGKPIKCYNCNGLGHIAQNCTQPKRPQNSDYFKDKMLLMQAQENGAVLDEEELLFLAGEQANTFDADVDNQPVQDLALNKDNIFQADECDAFDSDVDDEPTAQSIFMTNFVTNQDEHEIHNEEQQANIIDSTTEDMGNCNVIPYEQYLSINNISVVPSCASSVLNDACVLSDNDANVPHDPIATELNIYKEQVAIYEQRAKFELTEREQRMDDQMRMLIQNRNKTEENLKKELHSVKLQAKKAQPALYDGEELLKTHHVPVIVPSSEEDLELAEITKIKMHEKMNDCVSVEKRLKANKSDVTGTLLPQPLESQNFQLQDTINKLQKENDCFRAENSKIKQHYKELYDSIKITHVTHIENITSLLNKVETLKTQVKGKMPVITNETVIPKVSVCNKYAINVEPIPPTQRNNRNVQQGYLNRLKDTLDTLREIVEEARSKRTSDNSLEYACVYTKTSQELVYYVEGLGHNLFSVGQFCDSDLEVAFRKHTCFVRDLDGVDLIKGSRGTNLYTISVEDMMRSSPIFLLSKASKNKSWLWHRRLNHLNFGTLNDLARKDLVRGLPWLKFEKDHLCSACQLGKSRKATHKPKMINTITEVLHTLHMDLCGPLRVQSINGKKYILVIVDDYSRFTWVKFLRSKDETPVFVINLLKQLQNPDLLFLRVFGSLCYPTNDNKDLGKLTAKADIGFFIGYAPNQKGYRIYNKRTRQIMETIQVTFDEMTGKMTPVQLSSGPAPTFLMPGQISSGLVPPVPAAPYVPPHK